MLRKILNSDNRLIHTLRRAVQSSYLILFTVSLFLLLFILTLAATNALITSRDELSHNAYQQRISEDKAMIEREIAFYSQILMSGVGLLDSVEMSPEIWQRYIASYEKIEAFPETYMFGVSRTIDSSQIPALEYRLSSQYDRQIEVFPKPTGQTASIVTYVERGDLPVQSLGFNLLSLPDRAAALRQATDSGEVILSGDVRLAEDLRDLKLSNEPALMFVAPYYSQGANPETQAERRANIAGHIYLILESQPMFESVFKDTDFKSSTLSIRQGGADEDSVIYKTPGEPASGIWSEPITTSLSLYGQDYELEYMFNRRAILSPLQVYAPILTFIVGTLLSLAVPALIHIFIRSRQNALRLASERQIKQAQDELLSLASHQLRTPATATKQYMGMILQGFAGEVSRTQKDLLAKAYDSNERQLRVINDILHVAKLDAGRIVPSMQFFNITEVVKSVIEDYSSDLRSAEIKLSRRLGRSTMIYGDEYMIRMIVENLISNAIKYTPPGGRIEVRAIKDESTYRLAIHDTGVGIAKKDLDRLFKQFSRIPNERTSQVTGTGVGLYLAQNLASLHKGRILVESKEHRGSTFTLELPKNM